MASVEVGDGGVVRVTEGGGGRTEHRDLHLTTRLPSGGHLSLAADATIPQLLPQKSETVKGTFEAASTDLGLQTYA